MFADTDFILALVKDSDWLKQGAEEIYQKHKGKLKTSVSVMIELALICKRLKMNALETFVHVFEIIDIDPTNYDVCLRAALYIENYNLNVFEKLKAENIRVELDESNNV